MDSFDFFIKTNQKNIQSQIKIKVENALDDYERHVENKRNKLRNLLEFENLQNEEKLIILEREFKAMYARKRELFEMETKFHLDREREQFLKSKEIQRETENSEKFRESESQKFLRETKMFQLQQIEDKKRHLQKLKDEDQVWLITRKKLQELHDNFEMKEKLLKKQMHELDHDYLVKQLDHKSNLKEAKEREKIAEFHENQQSMLVDLTARNEEMQRERSKKIEQSKMLDEQLKEIIQEKEKLRIEKIEFNRQFELALKQMKAADDKLIQEEKAEIKESTMQYLDYVTKMKQKALEKFKEEQMEIAADKRLETNNRERWNKGLRFYTQNLQR